MFQCIILATASCLFLFSVLFSANLPHPLIIMPNSLCFLSAHPTCWIFLSPVNVVLDILCPQFLLLLCTQKSLGFRFQIFFNHSHDFFYQYRDSHSGFYKTVHTQLFLPTSLSARFLSSFYNPLCVLSSVHNTTFSFTCINIGCIIQYIVRTLLVRLSNAFTFSWFHFIIPAPYLNTAIAQVFTAIILFCPFSFDPILIFLSTPFQLISHFLLQDIIHFQYSKVFISIIKRKMNNKARLMIRIWIAIT